MLSSGSVGISLGNIFNKFGAATSDVIRTRYHDPYLDVASRSLPSNIQQLYDLCVYYSLTHPIISPIIYRRSAYPITSFVYESSNISDKYTELFEKKLRVQSLLLGCNLDRYTYGSTYVSPIFPFIKMLTCTKCGYESSAQDSNYVIDNGTFMVKCPRCGTRSEAKARDIYLRQHQNIRMRRWNPKHIRVVVNEITGDCHYYFVPPASIKNAIKLPKYNILNETPQIFIDAIRENKEVKFDPNYLFVMKREAASNSIYPGYGHPLVMTALKETYLVQIFRKAQESMGLEHVLPMRVMFPADAMGAADMINLSSWQQYMLEQVKQWRIDQNRFIVVPFPIGYTEYGGRGKMLMLHPEIRQMIETICIALLTPPGLLFGDVSYSGGNVTLRMLENDFLFNREEMQGLIDFIVDKVSWFMGWPTLKVTQRPFKMADDLQRAAFDSNLTARNWLSINTLLQTRDYDFAVESENMLKEAPVMGKIMATQQMEQQKIQQSLMGAPPTEGVESPMNGGGAVDVHAIAKRAASDASNMSRAERTMFENKMHKEAPGVFEVYSQYMSGVDMRPSPEQKPPTRTNALE